MRSLFLLLILLGSALAQEDTATNPKINRMAFQETNPKSKTGTVYLADVYNGPGLTGVPLGKVKKLCLFSYYFAHHLRGGHTSVHVDVEAEYASFREQYAQKTKPKPIMPASLPQTKAEKVSFAGWSNDSIDQPNKTRTVDLGAGVSMELVYIPAGEFVKASSEAVRIDKPFWMGKVEVTNEQYHRFNPDHESKYIDMTGKDLAIRGFPANRPSQPVIRVAWKEAVDFCDWVSTQTGSKVSLPTEAQWEWACRAGTATPFWFGDLDADFSTCANLADRSIRDVKKLIKFPHSKNISDGQSIVADVGLYDANPWGLHDMHGNVSEWTLSTDQKSSEARIVRGGSWRDRAKYATASHRQAYPAWQQVFDVGFRIVVEENSDALALNH